MMKRVRKIVKRGCLFFWKEIYIKKEKFLWLSLGIGS